MSRFRLIVAACLILGAITLYGSFSKLPDLPPEPDHIEVRGSGEIPQNAAYEQWKMAKEASVAGTGTAVTIESDTIGIIVGFLTLMTLLLALLSKYLIAPLITRELSAFMGQVDDKFVSRQVVEAHLNLDDARYEAIEKQLDQIWQRVK